MKVSRSDLKSIVKECLLEILREGLGSSSSLTMTQETRTRPTNNTPQRQSPQPPSRVTTPQAGRSLPSSQLRAPVKALVKELAGSNPVMESIIADTLQTTYAEQPKGDGVGSGLAQGIDPSLLAGLPGDVQFGGSFGAVDASLDPDPSDLTGDAANWAAILDRV